MNTGSIADLRRHALAMIVALRGASGTNLDQALRRHRVQTIHDTLTELLHAARRAAEDSPERVAADKAMADILWALSASAERFGWDWDRLQPAAGRRATTERP